MRVLCKPLQQGGFLLGLHQAQVDDVHRQQVGFARVKTALEHLQLRNLLAVYAQRLGAELGQRLHRVCHRQPVRLGFSRGVGGPARVYRQRRQGQLQFGDSDHAVGKKPSTEK